MIEHEQPHHARRSAAAVTFRSWTQVTFGGGLTSRSFKNDAQTALAAISGPLVTACR